MHTIHRNDFSELRKVVFFVLKHLNYSANNHIPSLAIQLVLQAQAIKPKYPYDTHSHTGIVSIIKTVSYFR